MAQNSNNQRPVRSARMQKEPTPRKDGRGAQSILTQSLTRRRQAHKQRQVQAQAQSHTQRQAQAKAQSHAQSAVALQKLPLMAAAVLIAALVLFLIVMRGCIKRQGANSNSGSSTTVNPQYIEAQAADVEAGTEATPAYVLLDEGRTTDSGRGVVSFAAFGDNLMNENLLELADAWSGTTDDGVYDFSPFYTHIAPLVQNDYDISFVNQETTMGGTDEYGYAGWPSYNTPDEAAAALSDVGFRLVATNSNHTYDTWVNSIRHNLEVWDQYPLVLTAGSYESESDRQTVRVVECNGIRISFLSYSYGQNGYEQSDLPNAYYAVPIDKATIAADVERAKKVSDVVLVYMHWGEPEYVNDVNDTQHELAQYCADLGVDLVIGSHVHVIQPMEWIERSDGSQMLCVYGLGDFVSGYDTKPETVLSGMFTCDFKRQEDDSIAVENIAWHPLIEHREGEVDEVWLVRDYTEAQAQANELLASLDDPYSWLYDYTPEVVGSDFTIDQ